MFLHVRTRTRGETSQSCRFVYTHINACMLRGQREWEKISVSSSKLSCSEAGIIEQRGEGGRQGHLSREWHQNKVQDASEWKWIHHCSAAKTIKGLPNYERFHRWNRWNYHAKGWKTCLWQLDMQILLVYFVQLSGSLSKISASTTKN